jgi:hypothetical protein
MTRVSVSRITKPYWERIPEEERAAIEAAVPYGMRLYLYPGYKAKPGTTTVELRSIELEAVMLQQERGRAIAQMCRAVLGREARARG